MSLNNEITDGFGHVVGFRCSRCDIVKSKMRGNICNSCRTTDEQHFKLMSRIQEILERINDKAEGK